MWQDPIVAEIHQAREKIARHFGNDIHAIFAAAQRGELSIPLQIPSQDDSSPLDDIMTQRAQLP